MEGLCRRDGEGVRMGRRVGIGKDMGRRKREGL